MSTHVSNESIHESPKSIHLKLLRNTTGLRGPLWQWCKSSLTPAGLFWAIFKAVKRALPLRLVSDQIARLVFLCLSKKWKLKAWSSLIRRSAEPRFLTVPGVCVCARTQYRGGKACTCVQAVCLSLCSALQKCGAFFFLFCVCVCVCSHHHNSLVQCGSVGRGSQRLGCGNSDTHRRSDVLTFLPNKFPPPSLIIPRVRAGSWRHIGQGQNN